MLHLKIAFQFLKKSIVRTISILLVVTVGTGVLFFLLTLGDMLNNMILQQTTLYQEHIILKKDETININDLDYNLLDDFVNNVNNIENGLIKTTINGVITSDNLNRPYTPFTIIALSNPHDNNLYKSFYGLDVEQHIIETNTNNTLDNLIMIDDYFAKQNNLHVGDIITFNHLYNFQISHTFDLGLFKESRAYAYIPLELLNLAEIDNLEYVFQLKDPLKTKKTITKITNIDNSFEVSHWELENPLFKTLNLAQRTVVVIINIMISIGIFAIVLSLLNFFIKQKHKQLGFLKAMGFTNKDISKVFLTMSALLTILAAVIGLISASIAMKIYAKFMSYPDGTPRFSYSLLWYNYLFSFVLILITIILSTIFSIKRIKDLSIIELIKI